MIVQFRFRRGTTSEWATANPTLASAEPGYNSTLQRFKIGDGIRKWNDLPYQSYNAEELAGMLEQVDEAVLAAEAARLAAEAAAQQAGSGGGGGGGGLVLDSTDPGMFILGAGFVEDPQDPGTFIPGA